MTPSQKRMLVTALTNRTIWACGAEFAIIRSLNRRGWISSDYALTKGDITPDGLLALEVNSPPVELYKLHQNTTYLLVKGRPVAEVVHGQEETMEKLLGNQDLRTVNG